MPVTSHDTLDGQIRGQSSAGVRTDYLTDALGSVTATLDQSQAVQATYRYKPYGQRLAKTGSGVDPRFLWTGDTGSRVTGLSGAEQYNVRRHYGSGHSNWTSVDPLWPGESAYGYARRNPTTWIDPGGTVPQMDPKSCGDAGMTGLDKQNDCLKKLCTAVGDPTSVAGRGVAACIEEFNRDSHITSKVSLKCLADWCSKNNLIPCVECNKTNGGVDTVYKRCEHGPCRDTSYPVSKACAYTDPDLTIKVCFNVGWEYYNLRCPDRGRNLDQPGNDKCDFRNRSLLHEVAHVCSKNDYPTQDAHQRAYDKLASCLISQLGCRETWYR